MKTVAIVGVGLIGGSFALALRKAGFAGRILGVSSERSIAEAQRLGVIGEGVTLERAEQEADLLYLAQPILVIIEQLERLRPRPGVVVTDAGSTKVRIAQAADGRGYEFIGGHPMAGKESRGVAAADADLFRGRSYVLLKGEETPGRAWLRQMITRFGAKLAEMQAEEHDSLVAHTSHLPQILSTVLAGTLGEVDGARRVAGPALLDMTRIAQSPFEMWHDIFVTNRAPIAEALASFARLLDEARGEFESEQFAASFEKAARVARRLRGVEEL